MTRTDPDVAKHKGLTYFYIDMKSLGIEIRPIKQITGESSFSEVYFTDVRVPDAQRLGSVGQGWQVALTTLMNERLSIGVGGTSVDFDSLFELAETVKVADEPALKDSQVRARLADWYCQEAGLKYTAYRSLTSLSRGETPGPENSISKLVGAAKTQAMSSFAMDLMEQCGVITDESSDHFRGIFPATYMGIPGMRIAGGTDEILLNIIAERVLGMPPDIRVDKGIPFTDIPTHK